MKYALCAVAGALVAYSSGLTMDDWRYWVFVAPACLFTGFAIAWLWETSYG